MDAEKVASCISLMRGLGFQAIISATNDKIQNYLYELSKKIRNNPVVFLNQADEEEDFRQGKEIAITLQRNQQVRCYLTHYESSDRA